MSTENLPKSYITAFPPILGIEGLSNLLHKKPSVIIIDRCKRPYTLPPACTPPGTKQPLWVTEDVINWLRQFEEPNISTKPKIGAPTKTARIRKRHYE